MQAADVRPLRSARRVRRSTIAVALILLVGAGLGAAARPELPGIADYRALPSAEAGRLALEAAEALSDTEPEMLIQIARVYLLSGDARRAQRLIDRVEADEPSIERVRQIGLMYAEAGEAARADSYFRRVLLVEPRDEHALSQFAAALIRRGDRTGGEALLARALALDGKDERHYTRVAEAYLQLRATR